MIAMFCCINNSVNVPFWIWLDQVRSGQVRKQNGEGGEGVREEPPALVGRREYEQSDRVIWGVMEFGMSRKIKPKEKYAHFNEGYLAQFGRSAEK